MKVTQFDLVSCFNNDVFIGAKENNFFCNENKLLLPSISLKRAYLMTANCSTGSLGFRFDELAVAAVIQVIIQFVQKSAGLWLRKKRSGSEQLQPFKIKAVRGSHKKLDSRFPQVNKKAICESSNVKASPCHEILV